MTTDTRAFTPHQSAFFAHRITLEGVGDDALAQSLSTARVDMNPHQVDAPLFALGSLLSKGVILADEVGLGKTIEASLVIAQRWAERRRRILLIVPASLLTCSDIDRFRTVDAYCAWFFNFLRQDLDALTLYRLEVAGKRLAGYHASHKAWGPNAERVPSLIRRALSRPLAYGSLRRAATRLQLGAIPKRATVAN